MALPASLNVVLKALRLGLPPRLFSDDANAAVLKEGRAHARALARAYDLVTAFLDELLLLAQAEWFLARWEAVLELPVRPSDSFNERVARIRARLSRRGGLTRSRLAYVLAPLLGATETALGWLEVTRDLLDPGMTASANLASPRTVAAGAVWQWRCDVPWPSKVDDTGVRLEVDIGMQPTTDVQLTVVHANGTAWTAKGFGTHINAGDLTAGYETRSAFTGLPAAGPWIVTVESVIGGDTATVRAVSLRVSNTTDAEVIYRGYLLRPLTLGITTPLDTAQAELDKAGLGHVAARVVERNQMLWNDLHSLMGREPIGPL